MFDNDLKPLIYLSDEVAKWTAEQEKIIAELNRFMNTNSLFVSSITCAKCGVTNYEHGHEGEEQHPFFRNNLEMLEWEYERSNK
jgi:hypothetical protein